MATVCVDVVRPIKRAKIIESMHTCKHDFFLNGQCRSCGMMFHDLVPPFPYYYSPICKDSYNNCNNINSCLKNVQNNKKMHLVLDLDHTLLNSTNLDDLSFEEDYLKGKSSTLSSQDTSKRSLFRLNHIGTMTKLRPFVRTFLQEASKMFDMYVYTLGDRSYVLEMAKLLDPENKYFNNNSRIISQDCSSKTYYKTLDVLQKPENSVLILDDRENVWPNNKENLILMDKYIYFQSSSRELGYNCKSLAELRRDEDELDGALATILNVLRRIHRDFLNSNQGNSYDKTIIDVRQLMKNARKNVLKDCKIVFSGVIPKNFEAANHRLWRMAEELGATCVSETGFCVTHVVSMDAGTEKSRWAVRQGKFLVHPRWIEAAYILWRRQLEGKFPVSLSKRLPNPVGK